MTTPTGKVLDFNAALNERELQTYLASDSFDPDRKAKVLAGLAENAESFVAWLFPAAIITPRNARVGNIYGSPGTSLVIETRGGKKGMWADFADPTQKGGNLIDLFMAARGVPFKQAMDELAEWVGHGTRPEVNYAREQAVRKLKRFERDLGPQKGEWHYTDADNCIIASVYRFEPEEGGKEFLPWDAVKRRWGNPDVRPLYNLPGVHKSAAVVICEGEKAADALIQQGICATAVMGGSNSPLDRTDLEPLRGKEITIWPDADEPGRKFAAGFALAVEQVALSVRIIEPPADAPKGWDAADCEDPGAVLGSSEMADPAAMANELIQTVDAFAFDECDIPPRPWIIPGVMLSGYTHMLVAPGGSGKSLFTLQLAMTLASGEPWGDFKPRKRFKTLLINVEDDLHEQRRRLAAARHVMQPDMSKVAGMIQLAADPESIVVARADTVRKAVVATPIVDALRRYIEANDIGVLIVDPFAETFEGDENSNSEVKWAMKIWRDEIAKPTGCAVYLVHHTTKHAANGAGDANVIRGAGAIVNSTRISATLMPMTPEDANTIGIDPAERHLYVRYDDAKANQSLKSSFAKWFKKESIELDNKTADCPADEVGALVPWIPPDAFDGLTSHIVGQILDRIHAGFPTGARYTASTKGGSVKSGKWAGCVIMDLAETQQAMAAKVINTWLKSGVLIEDDYHCPERREKKVGLFAPENARPGAPI